MTIILSIMGRKGGITKTTVGVNLAANLALAGLFTVFVEADGQGNASEHMGIAPHDGFAELMLGERGWADVLLPVPPTFTGKAVELLALSASDLTREVEESPETPERLIKALDTLRGWADVVIVDTSPGATHIHAGCFLASDYVLLPTLCELDSINSVSKTLTYLAAADQAGRGDQKAAKVLGILPNRYSKGGRTSQYNLGMVHGRFGHEHHVFAQVYEEQAWAYARARQQSIYVRNKGLDYRERESYRIARRDFKPVVDRVLELVAPALEGSKAS